MEYFDGLGKFHEFHEAEDDVEIGGMEGEDIGVALKDVLHHPLIEHSNIVSRD